MYRILAKRLRHRKRINQKRLARKSGISESYLSRLEADNSIRDRTPTLQIIENLALALEICPRDIVFYPCIECPRKEICNKKEKDIRNPDEIENEILNFYL